MNYDEFTASILEIVPSAQFGSGGNDGQVIIYSDDVQAKDGVVVCPNEFAETAKKFHLLGDKIGGPLRITGSMDVINPSYN